MRLKVTLHGFPAKSLKWVLPGLVNDWAFHRSLCSAAFSMFIASWSKDGCQSMTSQHPKIASRAAWKEREEGNPLTPSFLSLRRKFFPETVHRFSLCLVGENWVIQSPQVYWESQFLAPLPQGHTLSGTNLMWGESPGRPWPWILYPSSCVSPERNPSEQCLQITSG